MNSIDILGCRVDAIAREAAVARIAELAGGSNFALIVTLGVEMVMAARRDAEFRAIVNASSLSVCDTIGLLLASRAAGGPLRERVTGVELIDALAARSARTGDLRLFLLGAAPGVAERAAERLRARFPGVVVSGARDGYFAPEASAAVAAEIARSGANVLCAGLGSPKQERWLATYGPQSGCGAGIGIGGSLDVLSGTVARAPAIVQRVGMEWAYRLAKEPRRWRRQLALPHFAFAVARERILSKGNVSS